MGKDPAVLFYTADFLAGVAFMSDAQIGRYIKLLCLQHQSGRLTKSQFFKVCKKSDEDVLSKFVIDDEGRYYNERMERESEKRALHSEKQRQNISKRWNKSGIYDGNTTVYTTVLPLENENENRDRNRDRVKEDRGSGGKEKKGKGFTPPTLDEVRAYCSQRQSPVDPRRFFDYFEAAGWVDSRGNPVRSWKQKLITWEGKEAPGTGRAGRMDYILKSLEEGDDDQAGDEGVYSPAGYLVDKL